MEWKIGEIKQVNGEWYQCVEQPEKYDKTVCALCAFQGNGNCELDMCSGTYRSDKKSVIFKKLEKVGEPTMLDGKLVQKILTTDRYSCNGCCFESPECDKADNDLCCVHEIYVEIKQNKEDMETTISNDATKHSNLENIGKNLKPFNLEAAKSGKPVCTRDGRKARIICFDMNANSPIVALVDYNGQEVVVCCHNDGRNYHAETTYNDLMMLSERKEGWVNLYRDEESKRVYCGEFIFSEREKAEKHYECNDTKVATVSINWEE